VEDPKTIADRLIGDIAVKKGARRFGITSILMIMELTGLRLLVPHKIGKIS
jgi:hypothetical protein